MWGRWGECDFLGMSKMVWHQSEPKLTCKINHQEQMFRKLLENTMEHPSKKLGEK